MNNQPKVTKFSRCDDFGSVEMTFSNEMTWTELSERYLQFLKGCGYHLEAQDLAEYFSELAGD